jgi:hypothetical protein
MPEHTDLANLLRAIDEAEADATAVTAPLTDAQANWQPGEGAAWSVVQCLDHLAKSNAVYTTHFLAVAERARAAGGGTFQGLRPTWAGRWFVKSLEPPPRQKTRTWMVRMRLSTALLVIPAHDRRHLWQTRQVAQHPGFPAR